MSKNGLAGGLSNRNGRVSLSYLPDSKKTYTVEFPLLNGGLNLYDLAYRLGPNESPDMLNLHWRDGALGCRDGQEWVIEPVAGNEEVGYTAFRDLFWDCLFVHVDDELRCFYTKSQSPAYAVLKTGVPTNRGTFFRYGEYLMYKNNGGYYRIAYNSAGATPQAMFPVTTVTDNAFVPVTYINTNPTTHAGTVYQPENRLSKAKTIWYSAEENIDDYYLPYGDDDNYITSVTKVVVDGVTKTVTTDYTVNIDNVNKTAYVHFTTAPTVPSPFVPNTVKITYESSGTDAYNSIMDCPYAIVYGGDQNLCVVVGGCSKQPNAYFWSGNDDISMNPFYFPMEHYNLAGDTESGITGFGKQQGFLVVLSERGVGKASIGTTTTSSDRLQIEMPYTAINSRIGCNSPWSIQLVDNNVVFYNHEHGVCFIADSSAAFENNIVEIGKKIKGNGTRPGLQADVDTAGDRNVCSIIYNDQYWIVANGSAYVWDFRLSDYENPTWFHYSNINAVAFTVNVETLYHLSADGGATKFVNRVFADYGEPIKKIYQFATQYMGGYDRLKNVTSVIFVVRSDTNTVASIQYITDYEERYDLTPLRIYSWSLVPLDLRFRFLGTSNFAYVNRRRPMCRHVKHFAMRLENNELDCDLSVISAELQYNYQGRQM